MICCRRSMGSRVTMATPLTMETMLSLGATSCSGHTGEVAFDEGTLAADDRAADDGAGDGGMGLDDRPRWLG